jgi:hypothetical protein
MDGYTASRMRPLAHAATPGVAVFGRSLAARRPPKAPARRFGRGRMGASLGYAQLPLEPGGGEASAGFVSGW